MKILILATDVFTHGGIARYTSALGSALGGMIGAEHVDVLSFFDWGGQDSRPTEFRFLGAVSDRQRAGIFSRLHFLLKIGSLSPGKYDLVIANHVALAPVAALIKLIFGTPYWVVCHSVEVWWGTSRVRHAALKKADLILPVSRYTADTICSMSDIPDSRVKLLYNAIPASFSRLLESSELDSTPIPMLKNGGPVLLSVCSLAPENEFKGVDTVIRALPEILQMVPKARYAVVGAGALRAKLEELAYATGVAESVCLLGEVSDIELAALYRACDLFVLPSRGQEKCGQDGGEGFGRVYIEAALAGKPVIGSQFGGAAEAVVPGRTGLLVNPQSIAEVSGAALTLLKDPELAASLGSEGRKWARELFSEDALRRSLAGLLQIQGFSLPAIPSDLDRRAEGRFSSVVGPSQARLARFEAES